MSFSIAVTGPDESAAQATADAIAAGLAARRVPAQVLDARTPGIDALGGDGVERRVAFVCALLARHGVVTIVVLPLSGRRGRERLRVALGRMIEVYVPVAGAAPAYEPPEQPEVELDPGGGIETVLRTLEVLGLLPRAGDRDPYTDEEEREVIRRLKAFGYL